MRASGRYGRFGSQCPVNRNPMGAFAVPMTRSFEVRTALTRADVCARFRNGGLPEPRLWNSLSFPGDRASPGSIRARVETMLLVAGVEDAGCTAYPGYASDPQRCAAFGCESWLRPFAVTRECVPKHGERMDPQVAE